MLQLFSLFVAPLAADAAMMEPAEGTFPLAATKAVLTLVVIGGLLGYMIWDAQKNRPE